jgi:hypothetical protein
MSHADGKGMSVPVAGQQYKAENLSVQVKCDNPVAFHYKSSFNCNNYLELSRFQKYITIMKEMLSPAYFQQSLKTLLEAKRESSVQNIEAKQLCLPDANPAIYIFCSDGSVPWPSVENYNSENVENIVRTIDDRLVPLKVIDRGAMGLLKQITDFYIRNGIDVTYILVPVHPFSYKKWKSENDSRGFLLAESTYRKFAAINNITIVGSYDPSVVGCKNTDFRDWVHPLPRCTNLIVDALKRVPSSIAVHN